MARSDNESPLEAALARLTVLVTALAEAQTRQAEAIVGIVGEREAALRSAREQDDQHRRLAREAGKSCQQRTQEIADRLYPTGTRWSVALFSQRKVVNEMTGKVRMAFAPDSAFPRVEINAGSAEEAQARYQKLCGIVSTEGQIKAVPVGSEGKVEPAGHEAADEHLPAGVEVLA